jgi:hypothetical protein
LEDLAGGLDVPWFSGVSMMGTLKGSLWIPLVI